MSFLIPIDKIVVGENRQRREFKQDALHELGESISRLGLMHAPVVRPTGGGSWALVAGERRLRAIKDLGELGVLYKFNGEVVPAGQLPVVSLGELNVLDAWEAELEENIRRTDLTWQERAKATASLIHLRQEQAADRGEAAPPVSSVAREIHGLSADEPLGDRGTNVRNEAIVARFLHDPEVAAAGSAKEAFKILKQKEEKRKNESLAMSVGKTFNSDAHRLIHWDCLLWMREAAPEQFDVILTDPPYGISADKFNNSGIGVSAKAHFYDDSYEEWQRLICEFAEESFRLAKSEAHLYAFCDLDRFVEFRSLLSEAGWTVHRTPLIWHNPNGFRAPWPDKGPQRKYELILYAVKGGKKTLSLQSDVIECRKDTAEGHPAQKPVELLTNLLRRSVRPGDKVFDPFAGSGSTIIACHELKLTCTGIEKDANAYGIALKRLRALSAQGELL